MGFLAASQIEGCGNIQKDKYRPGSSAGNAKETGTYVWAASRPLQHMTIGLHVKASNPRRTTTNCLQVSLPDRLWIQSD
jgi:hypothetical protein